MFESDDPERDAFMKTLDQVARDVGWQLERQRQHPLFQAQVTNHGEEQVRQWLLLHAIRTVREVEVPDRIRLISDELKRLSREVELGHRPPLSEEEIEAVDPPRPANDDWLPPGVLERFRDYYAQPLRE